MRPTISIGAFAGGVAGSDRLPYPDYPDAVKVVICNALRVAWDQLCAELAKKSLDVESLDEDSITVAYKEVLNRLRVSRPSIVPGFTHLTFETVVRDATVVSFDGAHVEKKPDLVFRTVSTSPAEPCSEYRGVFVECKIVSDKRSIGDYADKGMIRFVSGQYGWAMPSGVMLCYCRDGHTVTSSLVPHLKPRQKDKADTLRIAVLPARTALLGKSPPAYVSQHRRPWAYPTGGKPGPIALTHLWLKRLPTKRKKK